MTHYIGFENIFLRRNKQKEQTNKKQADIKNKHWSATIS